MSQRGKSGGQSGIDWRRAHRRTGRTYARVVMVLTPAGDMRWSECGRCQTHINPLVADCPECEAQFVGTARRVQSA